MELRSILAPPPSFDLLRGDGPLALFLDFDGTLVELAPRPDAIRVPAALGARLGRLSDRLDGRFALISGRSIVDLERHLGMIDVACAGSHGAHRRLRGGAKLGGEPASLPHDAVDAVRAFAAGHGFDLEDKPHGAVLHYRARPQLEALGAAFAAELAERHGLQVKHGKYMVELVRPGVDKGEAVRAFMQVAPFAGARPVFVGDDVTDEDGFAAVEELGGFGVLVGTRTPTAARHALADTAAVYEWLGL